MIILCLDWKQSWPFPVTSAVAESASTPSDRTRALGAAALEADFAMSLVIWSCPRLIPVSFLPSSHRRRSSGSPVCHLPDPAPGLSHEEKGRGQLRPGEETHLQESPHK